MAYKYIHKAQVRNVFISVYNRLGGDLIERVEYKELPMRMVIKWGWYFKYRHALLQVKYPKYRVETSHYNIEAEGRSLARIEYERIKTEMTTCKRMITKITNAIIKYEEEQKKTLIPNWEATSYLKTIGKLKQYNIKLRSLESKKLKNKKTR